MSLTRRILRGYSLMFRMFSLALLGSLVLMLAFSNTGSAGGAIGLKNNSLISGDTITLGDIFYGLDVHKAARALGPAPRPGRDMTLNARTLMRIAVALDLPWRPSSTSDYVVLSRAGTIIGDSLIREKIQDALPGKGFDGSYSITLSDSPSDIILPPEMPASVEIVSLNVMPDRNWFEATLAAPSAENPVEHIQVKGALQKMIAVPVLSSALTKGSLIGARDIEMIEIPEHTLNHDVIVNTEDLIGLTPRRVITAGKPVKTGEVEAPVIVQRGDLVTMTYSSGALLLTAQGKALENGAKGDLIRVVNVGSSKTIQAKITDFKEVEVHTF